MPSYQNINNINIRPARAEDAQAAVRLMLMAFPTDALLSMGNGISYENLCNVIVKTMQMEETTYSYSNIIVAELAEAADCGDNHVSGVGNGSIVGVIIAYDGAQLHRLRKPLENLLAEYIGKAAHNWEDETSVGEFYLDSLAVEPECRGMNIGSRLIEATIQKARKLGHNLVGLLVDFENPQAEKLYTRLGFEFVEYTPFMKHTYKHMQRKIH